MASKSSRKKGDPKHPWRKSPLLWHKETLYSKARFETTLVKQQRHFWTIVDVREEALPVITYIPFGIGVVWWAFEETIIIIAMFCARVVDFWNPTQKKKGDRSIRFDSIQKRVPKIETASRVHPVLWESRLSKGTSVVFAGGGGWEDREEESRRPRRRGRRDDAASTTPNRRRRRHLSKKEKGGSAFVSCTRNRTKTNTRRREVQHREETTTTKTVASNCSRTCRTPGEEDRPRHRRLALDLHF